MEDSQRKNTVPPTASIPAAQPTQSHLCGKSTLRLLSTRAAIKKYSVHSTRQLRLTGQNDRSSSAASFTSVLRISPMKPGETVLPLRYRQATSTGAQKSDTTPQRTRHVRTLKNRNGNSIRKSVTTKYAACLATEYVRSTHIAAVQIFGRSSRKRHNNVKTMSLLDFMAMQNPFSVLFERQR